ncbi:MAG TPA: GtrA family protein [Dehalococcoidia bacterium]|nr:GtrA family protein [Dehalococcoidia bacterium]
MSLGDKPAARGVLDRPRSTDVRGAVREFVAAHTVVIKFLLVGLIGYVIYQFVVAVGYDTPLFWFLPDKGQSVQLLLFTHGDSRFLIATLVATELSITGVFMGHTHWTFRDREAIRKPLWVRFGQFNAKALVSTLGILTVTVNVLKVNFDIPHYFAVPVGVFLAFFWNWTWDTQIVWRRARHSQM